MDGPHAHCVRCPPRGRTVPFGRPGGTDGRPPRSLRSLPPEGAHSALRAAGGHGTWRGPNEGDALRAGRASTASSMRTRQFRAAFRAPAGRRLRDRVRGTMPRGAVRRAISLRRLGLRFRWEKCSSGFFMPCVGIGDSMIYLVDRWRSKDGARPGEIGDISIYDVDFESIAGAPPNPPGHGLVYIDHLTHNVHRGRMDEWSGYYERLFNFREIRYFDLEGQVTGIKSRAMTSPCGRIRIPINEEGKGKAGQIQEYLSAITAKASSTSQWARPTCTRPWIR